MRFDGKTPIHPTTPSAANKVFGPTAAEVEHAERVIDAHRVPEAEERGLALLDGKLSEKLHVEDAERIASKAAAVLELERPSG